MAMNTTLNETLERVKAAVEQENPDLKATSRNHRELIQLTGQNVAEMIEDRRCQEESLPTDQDRGFEVIRAEYNSIQAAKELLLERVATR